LNFGEIALKAPELPQIKNRAATVKERSPDESRIPLFGHQLTAKTLAYARGSVFKVPGGGYPARTITALYQGRSFNYNSPNM